MNYRLKLRAGLTLAALLLVAACSSESNQNQPVTTTTNTGTSNAPPAAEVKQRGNALVRVVHAVPGGGAVDVFADDTKVFNGIAFLQGSIRRAAHLPHPPGGSGHGATARGE